MALSMTNVLFICSRNRRRSPTAEKIFADCAGIETASAGTSPDADERVTADSIAWADIVFVMEQTHRRKLAAQFGKALNDKRIVCLDIPDKYAFMDPDLVQLLTAKVSRHLR